MGFLCPVVGVATDKLALIPQPKVVVRAGVGQRSGNGDRGPDAEHVPAHIHVLEIIADEHTLVREAIEHAQPAFLVALWRQGADNRRPHTSSSGRPGSRR